MFPIRHSHLRHSQVLRICASLSQRHATRRLIATSTHRVSMPMKAGTSLDSLAVLKDQDAPVVKAREEYPSWVGELAKPLPGLAALRRMPNEEAEDKDIMRFLKLTRRQRIRGNNEQSAN